jgi:hypothetical protein
MISNWQRKAFTTKCFDPTAVVIWTDGTITITEFQQVYSVTDKRNRPEVIGAVVLAEILHVLLEAEFQEKLEEELSDPEAQEFYEADQRFYGGA